MIDIDKYIAEKFILTKDVQSGSIRKQKINDKFISSLTNKLKDYDIEVGKYPDSLSVAGKNNDFLLLTINRNNRYLYKKIMSFIDEFYPIRKKCTSNNQSVYIYPDYEHDYEKDK